MTFRADRRSRRAWTLQPGDYVHDGVLPMRVTGWEADRLVGVSARGTEVRATHPPALLLDVTRLVDMTKEHHLSARSGAAPGPKLAFIALTATGPSPDFNEIWEMSVRLTVSNRALESHWQFPVINLPRACADDLMRAGFYDRYKNPDVAVDVDVELDTTRPTTADDVARGLARHLAEAHPVLLDPDKELPHLAAFLRRHGQPASWRQPVQLTALAAGYLMGRTQGWNAHAHLVRGDNGPSELCQETRDWPGPLPWDPAYLAHLIGGVPGADDATAPGRLALTIALWEAVTAPRSAPPMPAAGQPAAATAPEPGRTTMVMPTPA